VAWAAGSLVGQYGYWCCLIAAVLTAFYSWRLLFMTFHGRPRADHHTMDHVHESPWVMLVPLLLLAVGAVIAGFTLRGWFIGDEWLGYWRGALFMVGNGEILTRMEDLPGLVGWAPLMAGLLGIAIAYVLYIQKPELPANLAENLQPLYRFVLNKWYFDEFYDAALIQPYRRLARMLWQVGDTTIIDGVPNGLATLTADGSAQVVKIQTGSIAVYAFAMLIGVVLLVSVFLLFR
jgi:NADH-quinone oxidoreductase subunit L